MRSIVAAALAVAVTAGPVFSQPTIKVYCSSLDPEYHACKEGVDDWNDSNKRTKKEISAQLMPAPTSSTERLKFYEQIFRDPEHRRDIDVLQIDVVWLGALADDLLDISNIL